MNMVRPEEKGFTLLEAIIYIALFSLLLGGMMPAAFQLFRSGSRNMTAYAIQEEAAFIDRKIYWALSGASGAASPSPGELVITRFDSGENGPLTFAAEGTAMTLARGRGRAVALNTDAFPVTDVVFAVQPSFGAASGVATARFRIAGASFLFRYSLPKSSPVFNVCER